MIDLQNLDRYRPNVGICLINRQGQVWLGQRATAHKTAATFTHRWQMPQGGMDKGETADQTAVRELYEETGVRTARLLTVTPGWLAYDFPTAYQRQIGKKWQGQRQKWALMLFEGQDDEVDLAAHEEQEFSDWRWADFHEVADLIVPFKLPIYEEILASFKPLCDFVASTQK